MFKKLNYTNLFDIDPFKSAMNINEETWGFHMTW